MTGGATLLDRLPRGGRLLIVRLGALGDVVRTLPAVHLIHETRRDLDLVWLVEPGAASLLQGHALIDEVVVLPRPRWSAGLRSPLRWPATLADVARFVRGTRRRDWQACLDFQGTLKSSLVARAAGVPERLGFDAPHVREGAHRFYTVRVPLPDPSVNRVVRAMRLAEAAGATPGPVVADLSLTKADRLEGRRALASAAGGGPGPIVIVVPGSSRRQSYKRYPVEAYGDVIRDLATVPCRMVLAGGPGEEELLERTARAGGGKAVILPPVGVRALAAVLEAADLFIGGDTGPMHLAWAAGTPVVAIFGPTRTDWNAPWGEGHAVVAPPGGPNPREEEPFRGVPAGAVIAAARATLGRRVPGKPAGSRQEVRS